MKKNVVNTFLKGCPNGRKTEIKSWMEVESVLGATFCSQKLSTALRALL